MVDWCYAHLCDPSVDALRSVSAHVCDPSVHALRHPRVRRITGSLTAFITWDYSCHAVCEAEGVDQARARVNIPQAQLDLN